MQSRFERFRYLVARARATLGIDDEKNRPEIGHICWCNHGFDNHLKQRFPTDSLIATRFYPLPGCYVSFLFLLMTLSGVERFKRERVFQDSSLLRPTFLLLWPDLQLQKFKPVLALIPEKLMFRNTSLYFDEIFNLNAPWMLMQHTVESPFHTALWFFAPL